VEDSELTIEHVFPRSWYPDGHPENEMLKAPSCRTCNQRLGKSEERVLLPLITTLHPEPRTTSIWERTLRSIDAKVARDERDAGARHKRGTNFVERISIRDPGDTSGALWTPQDQPIGTFVTESGIQFRAHLTTEIPWPDLEAVGIKFLRGCYYEHTGAVVPADTHCWVRAYDHEPAQAWDRVQSLPTGIRAGAFPFEYTLVLGLKAPGVAAATFVMWGAFRIFVVAGLKEPPA
jgi:hypothetical protein